MDKATFKGILHHKCMSTKLIMMRMCLIFILGLLFSVSSCEKYYISSFGSTPKYDTIGSDIENWCTSVFFPTDNIGFATTQEGEIFKTINGGENWNLLDTLSSIPLLSMYFLNTKVGYVFGGESNCSPSPCQPFGSIAFKTQDGGENWQRLEIPYSWSELSSSFFLDEEHGFAVGKRLCIRTRDGGETWEELNMGISSAVKIEFPSDCVGYAIGILGSLFKSEDSGTNWENINPCSEVICSSFSFVSENCGYANNLDELFFTKDGGSSWDCIFTFENPIKFIHFVDRYHGAVVSTRTLPSEFGETNITAHEMIVLFVTDDGGNTWSESEFEREAFNERCLYPGINTLYSLSYSKIIRLVFE